MELSDTSSDDTVLLGPIESAVSDVFPLLPTYKIKEVLELLIRAGVESVADLKYVTEEDLQNLKPIQRRKLLKAWSTRVEDTTPSELNHQLELGMEDFQLVGSVASSESSSSSPGTPTSLKKHWVETFTVQWNKMPKNLSDSLKKCTRPSPRDRREMIRIICDDIMKKNRNPGRKNLAIISKTIVDSYPASFRDDIGGEVIGDGFESVLKQMENRINNLRRTETYLPGTSSLTSTSDDESSEQKPKRAKKRDSYGCQNWQPKGLPEREDETSQKRRTLELKEMYENEDKWDEDIIQMNMKLLYFTIRTMINTNSITLIGIIEEYPFLLESIGMMSHFHELVGIELMPTLSKSLDTKGQSVMHYLRKVATKKPALKDVFDAIEVARAETNDLTPEMPGLIWLLTCYFGEKVDTLLYLSKETSSDQEAVSGLNSPSPCSVVSGTTLLAGRKYMIAVDKVVVNHLIADFQSALAYLFATYYVLNIQYPADSCVTLEFIQRCFVGINPPTSGKSRKSSAINPKVLSLLGHIKDESTK
ncbi:uncharacterized protein [Apostichopus japonicus]|uniref:uncharacterized protein n=1 Tax=Stichopus japonicus TaxID=307972 RepID=UPI003AB5AA89